MAVVILVDMLFSGFIHLVKGASSIDLTHRGTNALIRGLLRLGGLIVSSIFIEDILLLVGIVRIL